MNKIGLQIMYVHQNIDKMCKILVLTDCDKVNVGVCIFVMACLDIHNKSHKKNRDNYFIIQKLLLFTKI